VCTVSHFSPSLFSFVMLSPFPGPVCVGVWDGDEKAREADDWGGWGKRRGGGEARHRAFVCKFPSSSLLVN
jgi:hypothetical protein